MKYTVNEFLILANAFELGISLGAAALLLRFILSQISGPIDALRRASRAIMGDFQGGAYDLAVAIFVIFVGKFIRTQTVWEWRVFADDLDRFRVMLGIMVSTVGAICLIRVLSPTRFFNVYWVVTVILALIFAIFSASIS